MTPSSLPTPANSASSTAWIVNAVRPRLLSALCLAGLSLGALSLTAPHSSAAQLPQPALVQVVNTAAAPAQVQVVGPMQMQGAVETLNDVLYTPYFHTETVPYPGTVAKFTVPVGKRLIIETVTVMVSRIPGQMILPTLFTPNGERLSLAMQSQGIDIAYHGNEYLVGTHPIKLRIDGGTDSTQPTFTIQCDNSQTFWASVAGYLVDL